MVEIQQKIQAEIRAGHTLKFLQTYSDYNAPEWIATLALSNGRDHYKVESTDSNGSHLFYAPAATTELWKPGTYRLMISVSDGIDRYEMANQDVIIKPNLNAAAVDDRSQTKRILDAVTNQIEGRASREESSYSIAGRSISLLTIAELIQLKNHYQNLYEREKAADRINKGLKSGRKILIRMA